MISRVPGLGVLSEPVWNGFRAEKVGEVNPLEADMIFFDIDGTLLDFKAAERAGVEAVYGSMKPRSSRHQTRSTTPGAALDTSITSDICRGGCPSPNNSEFG